MPTPRFEETLYDWFSYWMLSPVASRELDLAFTSGLAQGNMLFVVAFDLGIQTKDAVLREVLGVELKDEASCDIGRRISVYVNVRQLYATELWPVKESQLFSAAEL